MRNQVNFKMSESSPVATNSNYFGAKSSLSNVTKLQALKNISPIA
jgi:hypothetical protein